MTKKEERFYLRWNRRRAKGKFKYMAWRALVTGVITGIAKSAFDLGRVYLSLSKEEWVTSLVTKSWLNMLVNFLVMTLFSLWFYSILYDMGCKRFENLVRTTPKSQLPKDYSVQNAPGVGESFPDFSWETSSEPKKNYSETQRKSDK